MKKFQTKELLFSILIAMTLGCRHPKAALEPQRQNDQEIGLRKIAEKILGAESMFRQNQFSLDELAATPAGISPEEIKYLRQEKISRVGIAEKTRSREVYFIIDSHHVITARSITFQKPGFDLPSKIDFEQKSSDLKADIERMWSAIIKTKEGDFYSAESILAAIRVFNTVKLKNKTKEEVFEILGNPKINNKTFYRAPFLDLPPNDLYYRFDTGMWGMQFNILFNENGRVNGVEKKWIH